MVRWDTGSAGYALTWDSKDAEPLPAFHAPIIDRYGVISFTRRRSFARTKKCYRVLGEPNPTTDAQAIPFSSVHNCTYVLTEWVGKARLNSR